MGRLFIRSSPPSSENADQNCEIMFLSPNLGKCILVGAISPLQALSKLVFHV